MDAKALSAGTSVRPRSGVSGPGMLPVRIICATRGDQQAFAQESMLGRSLARLSFNESITATVHCRNRDGLPEPYNREITPASAGTILVFTHDDVWIDDFFLQERLDEALAVYDVVGLAGNRVLHPRHQGWAFPDGSPHWDVPENMSGAVAHLYDGIPRVTRFGPTRRAVVLLDGVLLAVKADSLLRTGVRFDPRFRFQFYDLDFCRTASAAGLRLGTWPIAVTHASTGRFGAGDWAASLAAYRAKWDGAVPPRGG